MSKAEQIPLPLKQEAPPALPPEVKRAAIDVIADMLIQILCSEKNDEEDSDEPNN